MEKTKYFTVTNLQNKSDAILSFLNSKLELHSDELDIGRSALLILDMQNFFHDKKSHAYMPSAKPIIKPILELANLYNKQNRPIILTRHINNTGNAKMMDYWWRDYLTEGNTLSQLIKEIKEITNTELIIKSQYDAFYNTKLEKLLHINKIEQVVITGVITHLCCETTARSAFVHGYNVFFPIDGTATYNEEIHIASLFTLAHGFANITTIPKLIRMLNE